MRAVVQGALAGSGGGLALGVGEAVVAAVRTQSPTSAGAVVATALCGAALYGVPAAAAGAALSVTAALVGRARGSASDPLRWPARALALLVIVVLELAILFRLGHHFATAYRNASLAALAFAVGALGCAGAGVLALPAALRAARRLRRPRWVWAAVVLVTVVVLAPPLMAGPERALQGPFGFLGILAIDALDRAVPALLLGAIVAGLCVARLLRRAPRRLLLALSAAAIVAVAVGVPSLGVAGVRPLVGTAAPILPRLVSRLDRALDRDRDGYAGALGGGDCDDRDPRVSPEATEVPDNGRDEDCDGADLHIARRDEPRPRTPSPRAALPDDLSFLVITVDALNTDLGFLGFREWPVSPNLDRLAARSIVYERAYALGTYTAQSLPPMMTGRYPSELRRTSAHEVRYFLDNTFLAEILRGAGYRTAGAASHFLFAPLFGWTQGFERWREIGSEGDAPAGSHVDLRHSSRLLANELVRLFQDSERTRGRFFFWVHFLDPHKQYLEHREFRFGGSNRARYAGEVAYTDHHIGRVLQALAASPAADRTVVVLTGDHGEAFGQHGSFFHGRETWEEIIRVPLVVHVPGLAARRVRRRVSHIDLFPTVLDLAGLPIPPEARGTSLVPELDGGALPERPILLEQPKNPYYRMRRVFIDGGWKLHHLVEERGFRLFDLDHDPEERVDLAASRPDRLAAVRRAYQEFLATRVRPVDPVELAPSSATRSDPAER